VLARSTAAEAVIEAIRDSNDAVCVVDRGAYLRVLRAESCAVTRAAIEARLGQPFELPSDLEAIMPSFRGNLRVTSAEVIWSWRA
jgi:hypothetical protein